MLLKLGGRRMGCTKYRKSCLVHHSKPRKPGNYRKGRILRVGSAVDFELFELLGLARVTQRLQDIP